MNKISKLSIDTIRTLSMDAVQKANSGHPGTPMALAPVAYVLYKNLMNYNPKNPHWTGRDRFVLSCGHASMLQYSILHLSGFDVSLEDLKNFRQWESATPGHPEYGDTPGVETTTGPLGQGIATAVGMALAEKHLASVYNTEKYKIFDHYTYVICSDGDLMEGISHEAASIAGQYGLEKLICIFDNNNITIEGKADLSCSDDQALRFKAYGWQVIDLGDRANDIEAIEGAFREGQKNAEQPTLIILNTKIGYGAPDKEDTPAAHGAPLGDAEIVKAKEYYGFPSLEPFFVPEEVYEHMQTSIREGAEKEERWNRMLEDYRKDHPDLAAKLKQQLDLSFPTGWDSDLPVFSPDEKPVATRAVNSKFLNAVADRLPWLMGGSADLEPSTKTLIKDEPYFHKGQPKGRNIAWGIRELGMSAASTGMYLHGGIRPYAATFFIFTDYARPAIRLAALMKQPVIYVMTHDSVGLGEDGPTHQPIEHLASLRAMPNLTVIRPADANETIEAWKAALLNTEGPSMLVLSRQNLPILDRNQYGAASGVSRGAYILSKEKGNQPDAILIGTGSEVQILLEAQKKLWGQDIDTRVISMPSWELFEAQDKKYRNEVLPAGITKRLSIETGSTFGWQKWVGMDGATIGIDHFGTSAPYERILKEWGFTAENVVNKIKEL